MRIHEKDRMSWDEVFVHPVFEGYFQQYAEQSKQFEDKLKMVMSELRFQINSRNLDLHRLLDGLGFKGNHELTFPQFAQFLHHIHPNITKDEVKFFFEKMDKNDDGAISLQELSAEMSKHRINFDRSVSENIEEIVKQGNMKKAVSLNT